MVNAFGWGIPTNQVPDAHLITPPMRLANSTLDNPISVDIKINAGLPLATIDSAYHDIHVRKIQQTHHIRFTNKQVSMDRDFQISWQPVASQRPTTAYFNERIGDEDYSLVMLFPPSKNVSVQKAAREIVFVIDTSGSMAGGSIDQAKTSLIYAISQLSEHDTFSVVEFNSSAHALFSKPLNANQHNKNTAIDWISNLNARGGTEMLNALQTAYKVLSHEESLKQLVFITDGAVGNETQLFELIHHANHDVRLFTVGIGSAPNSYFMRKAAEFGRGSFTLISSIDEVNRKMSSLFNKLNTLVVSNIEIIWPASAEVYPKKLPDLYLGEPLIVSAKSSRMQGSILISGSTGNQEWHQYVQAAGNAGHTGVGKVWARAKNSRYRR